jgi:PERQ amino acid-rich with GYF domain-containing protein
MEISMVSKCHTLQFNQSPLTHVAVDEFVQSLLLLPSETEIISDSIYANSQTLDGRRFADEFVRRRKLADKGVLQEGSGTPGSATGQEAAKSAGTGGGTGAGGGWSEVAKKGPAAKEDAGSAVFKVVAAKKKGKR